YGFQPFDEYNGQLSNNGEWILLTGSNNDTLCSFIYSDRDGWPLAPDGLGNSLVPVELNPANNQNGSFNWRTSYAIGGSPGTDDLPGLSDEAKEIKVPERFTLGQNYPNPVSDLTYIDYMIPDEAQVQLSVYNIVGQHVITLVNKRQLAGQYQVTWDGVDQNNNKVTDGVYIYRIAIRTRDESKVITRKMMILK
ncbi:MAG: T9SS type A sorting domain-containing protein, partial [Bacteroidales bacterium]